MFFTRRQCGGLEPSGGSGHAQEVLGFVCRWCLFLLAVAGCFCIGRVGAMVADAAAGEAHLAIIVPDAIYPQGGDPKRLVWGYIQPNLPYGSPILSVCHTQEGPLLLVENDRKTLYPVVEAASVGLHRVTVTGMPHSAVAFQQESAILEVLPPGRKVFLIDAATYLDAPPAQQAELRGCMVEMGRRGECAFFDLGGGKVFLSDRAKLRRLNPDAPLLWAPQELGDPLATLHRAGDPIRKQCVVVTAQDAAALHAASAGFATELIAPIGETVAPQPRLSRHNSLTAFKEYLAAQPITH